MKYAVLFALAALPLAAQSKTKPSQAPSASPEEPRITLDVTRVQLLFTVSDKKGRFVSDLTKDDFQILESKKPQAIMEFTAETDLPLRLAILLDTSNSIRDRFRFIQEAASDFVNTVVRPHEDKAVIVSFDTTAELVADLTDNTEALNNAIHDLRPGGGTALYDAILFSCRDKLMQEQPRFKFRRAMVILSDGEDNQSRYTREQAVEMAQRAEVIVYAISTNISGIKTRGDKVLERFADATGGRVFFPLKLEDVAAAFRQIEAELRSQYAVAYRPADLIADGRFRSISIEPLRKGLRVRCRRGYYAPKR